MSNSNMAVALKVVLDDQGSRPAGQAISAIAQKSHEAARQQQRDAATVGAATARSSDQSRRASAVLAQQQMAASRNASSRILRDTERLHNARAQLGIRSERSLQREIIQTAIAYRRLEESGRVSGRELARAAEAARHKVKMLQREMRHLKTPSEWGKGLAAIGAGIAAGVAVAKRPLSETMAYDQQIAAISNTAYASEDVEGRQRGQKRIGEVIAQSVSKGGTREEAADALNELLSGKGGLSREEAYEILPTVQQMALAAGKKSLDIVPLIGALMANKVSVADMPAALGKMLHAAETSGYGVDNIISSLPTLLATQRDNYGISGMKGLEMALVDMGAITAGTNMPEESAQSLVALLNALKQPAVAQAVAKKLSIGKEHADLAGTIGKGVQQGVGPLETFTAMVDKGMANNKTYQRLKGRLEKGGSPADQEEMATFLESTLLRDLGISRQSTLAWSGYMSQRGSVTGLRSEYAGAGVQTLDTSSAVMQATDGEKVNQASQALAESRQRALRPITDAVGDVASKITEYAKTYPGLTDAIVGATEGIKVMTAAAVAFGGVKMLTGGGVGMEVGAGAAATGIVSKVANSTKALARRAPLFASLLGLFEGVQIARSELPEDQKKVAYTRTASSTAGGVGGAYAGLQAGAILGPWGMAIGGILGGIFGGQAGDELGEDLGNAWFGPGHARTEPPKGVAPPLSRADLKGLQGLRQELVSALRESPRKFEIKVELDGREIAASVNEHNAREARRN